MNPYNVLSSKPKVGTFSTWTTTDSDSGTYKEVGLYRTNSGAIERKVFDTVRAALDYGFVNGFNHRSHISYSDFLAGKGE
tara:strand:- start:1321 stop:1560 length:240 start_codon:yes stop_codon:yes gene_type:complete